LEYEEASFEKAEAGVIRDLYEIIENGSLLKAEQSLCGDLSDAFIAVLSEVIDNTKSAGIASNEKAMVMRYFGGLYFSYNQALQIDAALETAFQITSESTGQRDILLASILSATSDIVNTVGKQFAQPLQIRDSKGKLKDRLLAKILNDRRIDFFEQLAYWITQYGQSEVSSVKHDVIKADYREALMEIPENGVSVIYADPPYTRYHYSRYYHVLETICLRDTPEVSSTFANQDGISRGIYRKDRHQSPFCIKTQASSAFDELFECSSRIGAPLVLSYSPFDGNQPATPRMQAIGGLIDKAKQYYSDVELRSPGYFAHSKLNTTSKNFAMDTEAELLLVCRV
jgi:adenine-specific DNA methylase